VGLGPLLTLDPLTLNLNLLLLTLAITATLAFRIVDLQNSGPVPWRVGGRGTLALSRADQRVIGHG